jgi:hypothetical protein
MESDMNAEIDENVEFSEESGDKTTFSNIGEQESLLESTCESKDEDYDTFNLNISLAIVDSETDEVDKEFLEALTEIEGKKSFPCPNCTKVCKSKGGLTKHKNSKHQEADTEPGNTDNENCLLFESLAGIVESIKTNLIAEDLYGSEINTAIKSASCSEAFFAAVLPLYNKFSRKKNQDKLLEEFYGLIHNASKYLNCPDSKAASLIMIEIPDRLVGFFKVCQTREEARFKPATAMKSDIKLDPSEHGPLSYIAGYIVSKLYQKVRKRGNEGDPDLQALLQALKSAGQDNNFILARSRGGLVAPSHHLVGIIQEAEVCFRKNVSEGELVLRNIPTDHICESTLSSPVVKSLWENIVLESAIDESSSTQKLCLENILKLYLRVRSFSYAKDYISKYKIKEKQTKSKSLRKNLKRSKDN